MLDVRLDGVAFRLLRDVTLTFARSAHTAVVGPPSSGKSTLLALIAGEHRAERGTIVIGQQLVNKLTTSARPLLAVTGELDVPGRWSVQHALVNAVRTRTLDREDRLRELTLAAAKWQVDLARRVDTLSTTERARLHFARIELRKPAIVVADRLLRDAPQLADEMYRTFRIMGTTVISAPASFDELGFTDRIVVLDHGRIVQEGTAAEVYAQPKSEAAAMATGDVNFVPVLVRGNAVASPIGSWDVADPPFQGEGVAAARPSDFAIPAKGEESDFVFNIEEAAFQNGLWMARGLVTGGTSLRVALARDAKIHKGRLLALRYDPSRFALFAR